MFVKETWMLDLIWHQNKGCTIMTKIIIVDYSLEIVIAIIIYDHHNLHLIMFIPLFEAIGCHICR